MDYKKRVSNIKQKTNKQRRLSLQYNTIIILIENGIKTVKVKK